MLYRRGEMSEAAEHYHRAVDLEPGDLQSRRSLANIYLQINRPEPALEQFQALLAAGDEDADVDFGMGSALVRSGRMQEAEGYLRKTLAASPGHSGALNYLGMIKDLQGDIPGAIGYYEQALAADSTNGSARQNLSDARARANAPSKP
jgi:tetratricopeptide (TPR) repeat protein